MENGMKMLESKVIKKEEWSNSWGESVLFYFFLSLRSQMQMKKVCVQRDEVVKRSKLFQLFEWVLNSLENAQNLQFLLFFNQKKLTHPDHKYSFL